MHPLSNPIPPGPRPCPFCGWRDPKPYMSDNRTWRVLCLCGAEGPPSKVGIAHAIAAWNERAAR